MKSIYTFVLTCLIGYWASAQVATQTIAIAYYVDANSNCSYDNGEQIVNNVQTQITYSTVAGLVTSVSSPSFQTCSSQTLYCWNAVTAPINTISVISGGVSQNVCGNYTNVAYGTNSVIYLPVTVSSGGNVGVQTNLFSMMPGQNGFGSQNVASGSTLSICSNFGFDSLGISMSIANLLSCSGTNTMASRTYSLYCDNVLLDWFTITSGVNAFNSFTGVLNNSGGYEVYMAGITNLEVYPDLPNTFTVSGTHTLEVKSTQVYNNASSYIDYVVYFNPVPCSRISGYFYNDCNNNCTFDAGDSYGVGTNATGYLYNGNGVNITFNPNIYSGRFDLIVPSSSSYSLTQYPTAPATNFTACTTGTVSIAAATTVTNLLFGYQNNVPANSDPAVYLGRINSTSSIISPQVGATFGVYINNWMWGLCNSNNINNPGIVKVVLPKFFTYVSNISGPTPTVNTNGTVSDTLIYPITSFTSSYTSLILTFSAVVSATAVANTQFNITALIYPTFDLNTANNIYQWTRTIGGPFDPNGKYCQNSNKLPNGNIPFGTQDFIYEIGFQNIGSGPAINVTTLDTIDSNFDLSTLKVLQSSYPVSVQKDNVSRAVHFHFHDINLPGSQYDEPNSHGFVRYQIKLKPGVAVNTTLKNRAHNYFDLLEPVATNQTTNKLVVSAAVSELGEQILSVRAIPNPVSSKLKIEGDYKIENLKILDVSGKLILERNGNDVESEIDMENYAAGLYIIQVRAVNQTTAIIKVIKE